MVNYLLIQFSGGSKMSLDKVRMQISCKVPVLLWKDIKNIAAYEECTATDVLLRALKNEVGENATNSKYELGDRVSCEEWGNGVEYTNFLLACVDNKLGIYTKNGISNFRPLDSFKNVEKL